MSNPQPADTCHLDVAFSSDATPANPSAPIAMAYGYTDNLLGSFQGKGQMKETVAPNSLIAFFVFDTAPSPTFNVTSVTVSSVNKHPGQGKPSSPFTDSQWSTGTIVATGSSTGASNWVPLTGPGPSTSQSTGCNVQARNWWLGNFNIGNFPGQSFELTVTVLTTDNNQHTKTFSVDPEMVVDGGNK